MTNKKTEIDLLQRFIFDKASVRGEHVFLQESYQEILSQHPYPQAVKDLLGQALCVAALLSAIIKFDGRLTVQFRGQGKLKLLLAQCDNQFQIRGLANWEEDISHADLIESFNQGVLMIILNSHTGKSYQGIVAWRGNSLAESVEGYFQDSEQLATKLWLSVNEKSAAGFLLQVMPAKEKNDFDIAETNTRSDWERILHLSKDIQPQDLLELDYQALLNNLYSEEDLRVFPEVPVAFKCTCSRERSENAISILGRQEAEEELKDKHIIAVTCDFCNQKYTFDSDDVNAIFNNQDQPPSLTKH